VPLSAVPVATMDIRIEVNAARAATLPACTQSTSNTPLTSVAQSASNACAAVRTALSAAVFANSLLNTSFPLRVLLHKKTTPIGVVVSNVDSVMCQRCLLSDTDNANVAVPTGTACTRVVGVKYSTTTAAAAAFGCTVSTRASIASIKR